MSDSKKNGNPVIIIVLCLLFVCGVLGTIAFVMEMTKKKCGATPASEGYQIEDFDGSADTPLKIKYSNMKLKLPNEGFETTTQFTSPDGKSVYKPITVYPPVYHVGPCKGKNCLTEEQLKTFNEVLKDTTSNSPHSGTSFICTMGFYNDNKWKSMPGCIDYVNYFNGRVQNEVLTMQPDLAINENILSGLNDALNKFATTTNNYTTKIDNYTTKTDNSKQFRRLETLFREILNLSDKANDLVSVTTEKSKVKNPKKLDNYEVYLKLISKCYLGALRDAETLPTEDRKKQKIFLKNNVGKIFKYLKDKQVLKKAGLNDELINKMETDIQMTLFGEVSESFGYGYDVEEKYQAGKRGGASYICTAVKNTQKSVSDEDYQIISKFGKWAVQQPEYTKGLGLYFGAMRHLMPVISHMERDNDLFWDDLTDFFHECVDGVKSQDYDRVIHLFTVKSIHLAEKYFGGISHLKGVVPDDEYKVLQNVYDDRKKYVEKYVLAN